MTKPNATSVAAAPSKSRAKKVPTIAPAGAIEHVPTIVDYVEAFCDAPLTRGAVVALSALLARVVGAEIRAALPGVDVSVGHRSYGGSTRRHHLDVFVSSHDLGLQIGIDVKGLNSASSVGKNWNNRVGDLHEMANNHHAKFPYAVMGGVLAIPHEDIRATTLDNIVRTMSRLGGRQGPKDAGDQMECAALLVISKKERRLVDAVPASGNPLRYETFATAVAAAFRGRHH